MIERWIKANFLRSEGNDIPSFKWRTKMRKKNGEKKTKLGNCSFGRIQVEHIAYSLCNLGACIFRCRAVYSLLFVDIQHEIPIFSAFYLSMCVYSVSKLDFCFYVNMNLSFGFRSPYNAHTSYKVSYSHKTPHTAIAFK